MMQIGRLTVPADRALIMGILNVTPDSFSDGGRFVALDDALKQAENMVYEGADIIDIGGESTRPGAAAVSEQQELDRVLPVFEALAQRVDVPLSADTSRPEVMRAAVSAGASMINDVRALQRDGALRAAVECGVPVCLMHMQGTPETMQAAPHYDDVVENVVEFLQDRIEVCVTAGIDRAHILVDPGFGFGKTLQHNLSLLQHLPRLRALAPVLTGLSRKRMIGEMLSGLPTDDRTLGSAVAALFCVQNGASIVRVHDVISTRQALAVASAVTAN